MTLTTINTIAGVLLAVLLIAVARVDSKTRVIPNSLLVAMVVLCALTELGRVGILYAQAEGMMSVASAAVEFARALMNDTINGLALGGGLFVFCLMFERLAGRASMGGGDIKLIFVVALNIGSLEGLFALLLACVLVVVYGVADLLFVSKDLLKDVRTGEPARVGQFEALLLQKVAFGPFVAAASIVVVACSIFM